MNQTILPHELPGALDRAAEGIKVLSLDCFDTLLWRDCHAPSDVFAGLEAVSVGQRVRAETQARKLKAAQRKGNEVTLAEIYAQAMPGAPAEKRDAAITQELTVEAQTCFAFAPTVELMREARARGITIIIVSDTYLDARQLLKLIEDAAGKEVAGLIDRVFASSEAGLSKSQGLLAKAIKAMKVRAGDVLHIGDNFRADFESARALGIPALHLAQFSEPARSRMRLERASGQMIGDTQNAVSGLMPHRALLAAEEPQVSDKAEALGLSVLGPVFHAFDQWLRQEADALAAKSGGRVHWLFMLRDGHLPQLVHAAGGEAASTARVEISRFTAIAADLTTREAYDRQWMLEATLNPPTLARQMLLDESEIASIVGDPKSDRAKKQASQRLHEELRKGQRHKLTRKRSRERAERLIAHIRQSVDPGPGDVLMLVDLGYNGSAQDRIDALLANEFDCQVAGRYLLLREMAASGLDKKGLIDARHFDPQLLEALCANVAVLEQLATCAIGSAIDYTAQGEPIRTQNSLKGAQSAVRERVQNGAVRYARAAARPPVIRSQSPNCERSLREAASATLMRFMFLPEAQELEVIKSFEHDVNLGSERMVALFDQAHAKRGMRRRGLFYMKGSERMFLPAELEADDIHTRLSLLVHKRFGLGLSYTDGGAHSIGLPAIVMSDHDGVRTHVDAQRTHEGFLAARVPVPKGSKAVALVVGSVFEWFELAEISISPIASLKGETHGNKGGRRVTAHYDGSHEHAPGLIECTDPGATLVAFVPPQIDESTAHMIEFVLRPLRMRSLPAEASQPNETPTAIKDAAA
ncbi:hydrolase [Erythrobacter sp. KY5]|uniref:HAD family hydrolase n=1 Tax=Erythrobacter sp. KY5 TaxID=2011159 RepID=UPI000DBF0383|nr:HAD family hydrolase [Erythrobacter sp. KY5]AWW73554.1 hydrolase [Erythrobacter sp. KY5]